MPRTIKAKTEAESKLALLTFGAFIGRDPAAPDSPGSVGLPLSEAAQRGRKVRERLAAEADTHAANGRE